MTSPVDAIEVVEAARSRALVGGTIDVAQLPPRAARAITVSNAAGAPAIPALDAALAAEEDRSRRRRALEAAGAQARSVAGALAVLPAVAVPGMSALLGEPLWRFYLTSAGVAVAVAGLTLVAAGLGLAHLLVVGARRAGSESGWDEVADLVATAMSGGLPPAAALRLTADVATDRAPVLRQAALGLELDVGVTTPAELERILRALRDGARHGAPTVARLRRIASETRQAELGHALVATERLPARLTFPAALCLMPACVLLVGAPLVALGLAQAGGA